MMSWNLTNNVIVDNELEKETPAKLELHYQVTRTVSCFETLHMFTLLLSSKS
jgi:hypothetical protein